MRTSLKRQKNATAILVDALILAMIEQDCRDYHTAYKAWLKNPRKPINWWWQMMPLNGMTDARERLHLFIHSYEKVDRICEEIERNGYHGGVCKNETMTEAQFRINRIKQRRNKTNDHLTDEQRDGRHH